jgi:hypothetical protein
MAIFFRDLQKKNLLWKWIAEDITEDMGSEEQIFSVMFLVKIEKDIGMFTFVGTEDPPLMSFMPKTRADAFMENATVLNLQNGWHPYMHAPQNKVNRSMIKTLFGEDEVAVQ